MRKPKLLDLFCGAGGAGMGYHRAGFEVVGVDVKFQPNYPFKFIQADALWYLATHGHRFDVIHASPPCQAYCRSTVTHRIRGSHEYVDLVGPVRLLLHRVGRPYVMENVPPAPVRPDLKLCGEMFGLGVIRWRWFEIAGFFLMQPGKPTLKGDLISGDYVTVAGNGHLRKAKHHPLPKFYKGDTLRTWRHAMGIDWMQTRRELAESIPPAYTEFIGSRVLEQMNWDGNRWVSTLEAPGAWLGDPWVAPVKQESAGSDRGSVVDPGQLKFF